MSEMIKIPEGWDKFEIQQCCDILDNQRIPLSDAVRQTKKGNIPYYGANGVVDYIDDYIFDDELILLAEDGGDFVNYKAKPIAYKINGKSWVNNHAHILKAKDKFYHNYIFYGLEHKDILYYINGGTRSKLNKSDLMGIELLVPKLEKEQQKIAEVLSEVDNAISKTEELFEKNKRIKTALMQDLLNYGVDENGKVRNSQTHKFKPSEIGDIPEEWACIPFTEFLNVIDGDRGDNYPTEADFYKDEFCLFLNAKNVTKNGFNFEEKSFITKEKDAKLSKGKLEKNDLILTTRGTVGNVAYFDKTVKTTHMRINSGMVILRIFSSHLHHQYFYEFLKSYIFEKQKNNVIFGSAQPQLTVAQIKKFYCNFPKSKTEQQKIAQILSSQDEKIEDIKNKLNKLKSLKTSLMQDLLSGKVRVTKLMEENS